MLNFFAKHLSSLHDSLLRFVTFGLNIFYAEVKNLVCHKMCQCPLQICYIDMSQSQNCYVVMKLEGVVLILSA